MNSIVLLLDPEQKSIVRDRVVPVLVGRAVQAVPFAGILPGERGMDTPLLT